MYWALTLLSFDNILSLMDNLTAKQRNILEFIASRKRLGHSPSQREMAAHFGLSQNAICQLVRYLRTKGYIDSTAAHRGVKLSANYLKETSSEKGMPVLGRIAAGEPILAQENIEDHLDLNQIVAHKGGRFFLRVAGESMVDAGIMDGDYVAVSPDAQVKSGDIAAVLLGDEATVKRIYFEKGRVILKAQNRRGTFADRHISKADTQARVIGKVTGCFRDMK
jgi:repressor LexA